MRNLYLIISIFTLSLTATSQSTFSVTTTGSNSTIDSAIDYSTDLWSQYLVSSVPIKINVVYTNLTGAGPLAITFPNGIKDYTNAPESGVWYASCLANSIAGTELNVGEFDMDIYVNTAVDYYYGLDGNPGANQYDFVSIFFHEISHGLGTASVSKIDAGVGSFGLLDASSTAPLTTSFPFPVLEGLPSIWDFHIVNGSGQQLTDTLIFNNVSLSLGTEFESDNLFFSGSNATVANGGTMAKMFAPSTYESGSSLQHFDEDTYPTSGGNSLLTPYFTNNEVVHTPGELLLGALQDIGWTVVNNVSVEESLKTNNVLTYPNPTKGQLSIDLLETEPSQKEFQLLDISGREVMNKTIDASTSVIELDLSELPKGTYLYLLQGNNLTHTGKVVKL